MAKKINVFPAPLVEAVVEIRFPGDVRIEVGRGEYQALVHSRFPALFVPGASEGAPPALQHYRFSDNAQTEHVGLAVNSFIFSTKKYPGWETFLGDVMHHWGLMPEWFAPATLTRVGIRFINRFVDELVEKVVAPGPAGVLQPVLDGALSHQAQTVLKVGEEGLVVTSRWNEESGELIVDLDAFARDLAPAALRGTLEELHAIIEEQFVALLEKSYAETLVYGEGG